MKLNTLQDLLIEQLHDLYSSEYLISEHLPALQRSASSIDLKKTFDVHLKNNRKQITRLQEVFSKLGIDHNGKRSYGMEGLLKEGKEIVSMQGDPAVKDAALIAAAQRIEHYEIAGYGSVRTYARELGYGDIAEILQETLDEADEADKQLTSLAKGGFFSPGINEEAPR